MNYNISIESINFDKLNGIIPVVVQDIDTLQVVMVGFMNKEALQKTLESNRVTFWSRSKQKLWEKGETSGHFLDVVSVLTDCDNDALLIMARTNGPVCHTGNHSCFGDKIQHFSGGQILDKLEKIIEYRKATMPEQSYTAKLFSDGINRISQKVGEEAIEIIIEALNNNKKRIIEESADLLYHLIVLLCDRNISLTEVGNELQQRMK